MDSGTDDTPPWKLPEAPNQPPIIEIDPNPTPQREAEADFSDLDQSRKRLHNKQYEQNIRERKRYANYAYRITKTWVCALICFVFAQIAARAFHVGLEKEEFITLVTTTTGAVFGFWWLVGKYLFGSEKD